MGGNRLRQRGLNSLCDRHFRVTLMSRSQAPPLSSLPDSNGRGQGKPPPNITLELYCPGEMSQEGQREL